MIKRLFCLAVTALTLAAGAEDENAKWGGELVMWPKDHGSFALVNAQQRVKPEVLGAASANLRRTFLIHFDERTGTAPDVRAAAGEVKRLKAKGAIWIVDDPELPVVLAAAESGWGYLNVAPLLADSPVPELLRNRLVRQMNRLFGYLHGVAALVAVLAALVVGIAAFFLGESNNRTIEQFPFRAPPPDLRRSGDHGGL